MTKFVIAKVEDIPEGEKIRALAGKRALVVVRLDGAFYALADRCPHAGASLANGRMSGNIDAKHQHDPETCRQKNKIKCPWHGWEYDIKTGQSWSESGPNAARPIVANTQNDEKLVKGPYVAETIPVTVEGDYIVVDV